MTSHDPFKHHQRGASAPATDAFAVTPDDGSDLPIMARALYVGGAGDVRLHTAYGNSVLFRALPAGTVLPCAVSRVLATDTTATNLVALV